MEECSGILRFHRACLGLKKSSTNDGCVMNEIPIRATNTNDNLSSTKSSSGNGTREQSAPSVQIDLGAEKQICGVKVQFKEGGDEVKFFTIQLSTNGTTFTSPKYYSNTGSGSSGEIYNFGKDPISTRYIKLTELGKIGSDVGWISDLRVLGIKD